MGHEGTVRLRTGTAADVVLATGDVVGTDGIHAVELTLDPGARVTGARVTVRPR